MRDEDRDDFEAQRRLQDLSDRVTQNRADINALQDQGDIDMRLIDALGYDGLPRHDQVAKMQDALRTSRRIGAAIGIVMATEAVGESDAFDVLCELSQATNRSLRDLAEDLVRTGDLSQFSRA